MTQLCELATKYITDKGPHAHNYTPYYSMFFEALKFNPIKLLEIGIDQGSSLRMWKEYFNNAEIHGIDIRGDYEYLNDEGIITHVVDQSKRGELIVFGEQYEHYFDIIIDDAGHESENQILSFDVLLKYLKSGGFYCIEDANCSYDKTRWGKNANIYDRVKRMIDEVNMSGKFSNDAICANKIQESKKYNLNEFEKNIEWVFNSMSLVIIKKI